MASFAMFPSQTAPTTVSIEGRTYTLAVGTAPIIVPDFDALVLMNNGWIAYGKNGAGTTAQRPVANPATGTPAPGVGYEYYDTTLSVMVYYNGKSWIKNDGSAV